MPYADLGDITLHYKEYGTTTVRTEEPPICFLHGFTLDHRMWIGDAEYFGHWYRVITPDAKGHGLSDAPPTGYSRDDRVVDLLRLLDHLGIDKVHLVGLSMGGSTGIGMALSNPERLASLTLVSTGAAGYSVGSKIAKIDKLAKEEGLEAARTRWIKSSLLWYKDDKKPIRDLLEKMMLEHSGAIWLDEMRGKYPKTADLDQVHRIKLPTEIMVGQMDKVFLPLARLIHSRIDGSRLVVLESVGHMLNLEAPEIFRRELKRSLERAKRSNESTV